MQTLVRVARVVVPSAFAAAAPAQSLTIEFRADREHADEGELVTWTVLGSVDDHRDGAQIYGLEGDLMPSEFFAGWSEPGHMLAFRELFPPVPYGAAFLGFHAFRDIADEAFSPDRLPLFTFQTRITDASAPLWFDFRGLAAVFVPSTTQVSMHARRRPDYTHAASPIRVLTDTVNHPGCDLADLASPWNVRTPADIVAFVDAFTVESPRTDLAAPWGLFDFQDIEAFFEMHDQPCPLDHE